MHQILPGEERLIDLGHLIPRRHLSSPTGQKEVPEGIVAAGIGARKFAGQESGKGGLPAACEHVTFTMGTVSNRSVSAC